jgi:hypothetical protein
VLPFGALVGIVVAVLIALLVWLGLIEFILWAEVVPPVPWPPPTLVGLGAMAFPVVVASTWFMLDDAIIDEGDASTRLAVIVDEDFIIMVVVCPSAKLTTQTRSTSVLLIQAIVTQNLLPDKSRLVSICLLLQSALSNDWRGVPLTQLFPGHGQEDSCHIWAVVHLLQPVKTRYRWLCKNYSKFLSLQSLFLINTGSPRYVDKNFFFAVNLPFIGIEFIVLLNVPWKCVTKREVLLKLCTSLHEICF